MIGAIRLWCAAPPNRFMGREPLLPGGEFLSGETGHYQGQLEFGTVSPGRDPW
jgi:hypothetical protein